MATGLAFDLDGPGIGGVGAEEDVHQGGLAGAVLAEQAEDVAGIQRQVDAARGLHRRRSAWRCRASKQAGDNGRGHLGHRVRANPLPRGEGVAEGDG